MTTRALVAVAGAAAFAIYFFSLIPGVEWWDTGEFQTVPYIAGILHPPGFPAYTIIGWLFSHVFIAGNVAWRMNLLSALSAAGATAALAYTARTLGASAAATLAATALFATSQIVWWHATRASVEPLALLFGALAVACAARRHEGGGARFVVCAALFLGLAVATHPVSIWFVPGVIIVLVARHRERLTLRTTAGALCAFTAALALYAYLPLRAHVITGAHLDPAATILGLRGQPFWNYDDPGTPNGFVRLVSGADFHPATAVASIGDLSRIPAYGARLRDTVVNQYGWVGACAAFAGVIALLARWPLALGLLFTGILVVPFSVTYAALVDPNKYYLLLLWIVALLAALGITAFRRFGVAAALLVAIVIDINVVHNSNIFGQRMQHNGANIIADITANTPPNAIVIAGWSYVTPLAYAAYVEKSLDGRLPLQADAFDGVASWTKTHRVYYLPFPENDLKRLTGVRLEKIANSSPPLYQVTASSSPVR